MSENPNNKNLLRSVLKAETEKPKSFLVKFILPKFNKKFFFRLVFVLVGTLVFFGYICRPAYLSGKSMEPSYKSGTMNFCWRPTYWFSKPERYDVVMIRFAGTSVMLLKRIVAIEGETVEFKNGKLLVNGKELDEPYVRFPCKWDLEPRKVEAGEVYVVGDNRSMPLEQHQCGRAPVKRIIGGPLF